VSTARRISLARVRARARARRVRIEVWGDRPAVSRRVRIGKDIVRLGQVKWSTRVRLVVCVLIIVVATAACSSGASSSNSSSKTGPPGAPSSASPRSLPVGTYEHNSGPFGPVILTLTPGRYMEAVPNYQVRVEGTVNEAPDGVTFTEIKGGDCQGVPGTYTITEEATGLKFTLVHDDCSPRTADWPSGPWTKKTKKE
jgi:hypothetical protein